MRHLWPPGGVMTKSMELDLGFAHRPDLKMAVLSLIHRSFLPAWDARDLLFVRIRLLVWALGLGDLNQTKSLDILFLSLRVIL